jgi:hypothetical protein
MDEYERQVRDAEDVLNMRSEQMGRLKAEFEQNLLRLSDGAYPKTWPYQILVYQSRLQQRYLEIELRWKEKVLERMQECAGVFIEGAHMRRDREAFLAEVAPKFEDAIASLLRLRSEDMAVLRQYEHPPQFALDTIKATLAVKGEEYTTWEDAKVMLADSYFFGFFISRAKNFDKENVSTDFLPMVQKFVMNPEFEPSVIAPFSAPCCALCKWVRAIYEHVKVSHLTSVAIGSKKQDVQAAEALRQRINQLREQLAFKRNEIAGAERTLQNLEADLHQKRLDLKSRYDKTLDPLQETFFEAEAVYTTTVCSPKKEARQSTFP